MKVFNYLSNKHIINFIKTYDYLIYIGATSWIFTPYNIISFKWWIALIVMFFMVDKITIPAWSEYLKTHDYNANNLDLDSNWFKRNAWAFILGMIPNLLGFPIVTLPWWIISTPSVFIISSKFKHLKERN